MPTSEATAGPWRTTTYGTRQALHNCERPIGEASTNTGTARGRVATHFVDARTPQGEAALPWGRYSPSRRLVSQTAFGAMTKNIPTFGETQRSNVDSFWARAFPRETHLGPRQRDKQNTWEKQFDPREPKAIAQIWLWGGKLPLKTNETTS